MNKGNTVSRGNAFEKKGFELLKTAFENGHFGVLPDCCTFIPKPKYKSKVLDEWFEFDMSIEVRLNPQENPFLIFLIEFKDYQTKIPGNDVAEFMSNMQSIGGLHLRPILISTTDLQLRAKKLVEVFKIVWIKIEDESLNTRIYNSRKRKNLLSDTDFAQMANELEKLNFLSELSRLGIDQRLEELNWPELIERFVRHALLGNLSSSTSKISEIAGLERLSGNLLEKMAENLLDDFNPTIRKHHLGLNIESFMDYLKEKHHLEILIEPINHRKDREILGMYITGDNKIIIDASLKNTERFAFVLAHEVAHFFLHRHLSIEQPIYEGQSDSIYNAVTGKHDMVNDRNWMEWQANKFASCLMMPKLNVVVRLIECQSKRGRRRPNHVHVDNVPDNWNNFLLTNEYLSKYFGVSQRVMEYRMSDIGILVYGKGFRRPNIIADQDKVGAISIGQLLSRALDQIEVKNTEPINYT